MVKRLHHWLLSLMLLLTASNVNAAISGNSSAESLFIETTLDNDRPWVGQEVLLTYTLFFSDSAPQIEDKTKPEHPGLWARELAPENYIDSTPVSKNGRRFRKAVIRRIRLVPMQSGTLSVRNYRLRCLVPKTRDITLDSRNDIEIIATAPPAILQARALPKPAPAEFSGAVGRFTLSVSPESNRINTREPLTLFITIRGQGNLDTPPPLTIMLPEGLQRETSSSPPPVIPSEKGSTSSISTKITLSALKTGSFLFAPVTLTAFDPSSGRYETVRSNKIAIRISDAPATAPQQPPPDAYAIAYERVTGTPPALTNAFIAILGTTVLALIFGLHFRYMKQNKRNGTSKKESAPGTAKPVKPAANPATVSQTSVRSNSPESLRNDLYDAIKKIGVGNPSGLTAAELGKLLQEKKVKAQTIAAVTKLLSGIDHALYAPGEASPENLAGMSREASRIIADLSRPRDQ
jgi:hypothetical protein